MKDALGIDPDLCWGDDDDRCYLAWNALDLAAGTRAVRQATVDLTTGALGPAALAALCCLESLPEPEPGQE